MDLNFAKTAPGVMTANWMHPKTGRQYSVAIIESCDTQHLFIDGELVARELATFDDAVALAKQKLASKQPSKLVRIAAALVIASAIGASVIAASKFMPRMTAADLAAAMPGDAVAAETVRDGQAATSDRPSGKPAKARLPSTDKREAGNMDVSKLPVPKPVVKVAVVQVTAPTPSDALPANVGTESDEPRRFSARNNLLALQALTTNQPEPEAKDAATATTEVAPPRQAVAPADNGTDTKTVVANAPSSPPSPAPIEVIPAKAPTAETQPVEKALVEAAPGANVPPPVVADVEPELKVRKAELRKPLVRPMIPTPVAQETEADLTADVTETASAPPLPAKGPSLFASAIGMAADTREAGPSVAPQRTSVAKEVYRANPRRPARRARSLPRRKARGSSPRRIVSAPQARSLVCFAHICRWR
jgi:hypothetical protein